MAKTCDLCGGNIRWKAFRCADGIVCKHCYAIVSNQFTKTIIKSSLDELRESYKQNEKPLELGEDGFQMTRKIGTFLVLDDDRKKFFIPSNTNITKKYERPQIFRYQDLKGYKLAADPEYTPEELAECMDAKKSEKVVKRLAISLYVEGSGIQEIIVIPTPVRTSTFAFRRSYKHAVEITDCLDGILRRERA